MTAIIDYDAGNLKSVEKALAYLKEEAVITRNPKDVLSARRVILPGVGAFGDAMEKLRQYGLHQVVYQVVERKIPLLGICLGLQLLFESSQESPGVPGLGVLKGEILRIPRMPGLKIPHMGWNSLDIRPGSRLFDGVPQGESVYFVHSYYLKAGQEGVVAASTEYGVEIHAAVEWGNVYACQFHPEKSGAAGLKILKNFIEKTGGIDVA